MKLAKYYFSFILCVSWAAGVAQLTPYISQQEKELFQQTSETDITHLYNSPYKEFTSANLFFNHENGENKQAQVPGQIVDFGLQTEGLKTNKNNIMFVGDFNFSKSYWNQSKWNLSYQMPHQYLMDDPHYYAVAKEGNWSNQNYAINGGMVIPIQQKAFIGLKADFELKQQFRLIDPRPEVKTSAISPTLSVGLPILNNHFVSLSGSYGKVDIFTDVSYSDNDDNLPYNTELYNRWQVGYGSLRNRFSNSTRRNNHPIKFGFSHQYQTDLNTVLTGFEYATGDQKTLRNQQYLNEEDQIWFNYKTETISAHSMAQIKKENRQYQIGVRAENYSGHNFIKTQNGKSFTAKKQYYELKTGYLTRIANELEPKIELSNKLYFLQAEQTDALSLTGFKISEIGLEPMVTKHIQINNQYEIEPSLKLVGKLNIGTDFTDLLASQRENIDPLNFQAISTKQFYDEVIYPDFAFASANQFGANPSIVLKRNGDNQTAFVKFDYQLLQNTNSQQRSNFAATVGLEF